MNPEAWKQAWQSQVAPSGLATDAQRLLEELRRSQQAFVATIFWRDVREVGTSLVLIPVWLYLGYQFSLPWTWYLTMPVLVWIAGFMLVDRVWQRRQRLVPGQPLRQGLERSLAQVEHQIWLLRNVFWWYLLPPGLSILAFFGQIAWLARSDGWLTALVTGFLVLVVTIVFAGVYRLNQHAVRAALEPRRQELAALLMSLKDETPAAS